MKTAVITGATKGIGLATAEKFASQGFDVAICARNAKDLETVKNRLEREYKVNVLTMPCDVAQKTDLEKFAKAIESQFTHVNVLVNNAGIFMPGQVSNEAEGTFETLMAVNVASAYHFTRLMLPQLMKQPHGHIFNMCSTASIIAYTNGGSYCISKYALYGMTKVLREELKEKSVKVTAVLPGATLTDSWAGTQLPESRFVPPADVAECIWTSYNLSPSAVVEDLLIRPQLGDIK